MTLIHIVTHILTEPAGQFLAAVDWFCLALYYQQFPNALPTKWKTIHGKTNVIACPNQR